MQIWRAKQTEQAIADCMAVDGGAAWRGWMGRVLPDMSDAYSQKEDDVRTHLGASVIGEECDRAVQLGWLWATKALPRGRKDEPQPQAGARMMRLWNRGHLEEGRMISMLLMIGIEVYYQHPETGAQYRVQDCGGHFGGSLDGIGMGCPDLPHGIPHLTEYKTHSEKSFTELEEKGVREAKPHHYIQMQIYMGKRGLQYALYMAVNKNTDDLYCEIVKYDGKTDQAYIERARSIIYAVELAQRFHGAKPTHYKCKGLCDHKRVCYGTDAPRVSCRTCQHSLVHEDGFWVCTITGEVRDKQGQIDACDLYALKNWFV